MGKLNLAGVRGLCEGALLMIYCYFIRIDVLLPAYLWVVGIEPRSFGRTASALNC